MHGGTQEVHERWDIFISAVDTYGLPVRDMTVTCGRYSSQADNPLPEPDIRGLLPTTTTTTSSINKQTTEEIEDNGSSCKGLFRIIMLKMKKEIE